MAFPGTPAAVAVAEGSHALALVARLQALQMTDRHVERHGGLDRRQSTGRELIEDIQPALFLPAQGDRRGVHRDSLPGTVRDDTVPAQSRGDRIAAHQHLKVCGWTVSRGSGRLRAHVAEES